MVSMYGNAVDSRHLTAVLAGCDTVANPSRLSSKGSGKAARSRRGASSATIMSWACDESDFHIHGVSWIPKSSAALSERIKAAHVVAQVHTEGSSKKNKKEDKKKQEEEPKTEGTSSSCGAAR